MAPRSAEGDEIASEETPRLDEIQAAIDEGDLARARRILLELSGEEERLLVQELGESTYRRARSAASRGGRRGKLGKVLLLPGIMGTDLDSLDKSGHPHRIWLNYLRLILGRISDLELASDGTPARPDVRVRTAGLHRKTYLAMLLELDARWDVRQFPFDWREHIDESANRLADAVKQFGGGDPVHLVAHSMGGLVSRRFVQRHRDLWDSMDDRSGKGGGGRLVMLGTPNHGSFAIPLTLTGREKLVKTLARADVKHGMDALLQIIGSFPGLYDMLPSPFVVLEDDQHGRLFSADAWGSVPARAAFLLRARSFIDELRHVSDPRRFVYVAGYNQPTPAAIRIEKPGQFSYRETPDGDGRVPHVLGLLDGVPTYWVFEIHGSLPKNDLVLAAITDLLQQGKTSRLPAAKPSEPAPTRGLRRGWVSGDRIEPIDPAIDTILAGARTRGISGLPELSPEEEVRLEDLSAAEYLGRGETTPQLPPGESDVEPPPEPPEVELRVVWGDVTRVEADVYAVGHYEGVEPQHAELALDKAVSGISDQHCDARRLVITQHTRRGMLRGALGDVSFFPWGDAAHPERVVAIAGMGRPGTFDRTALKRLVRSLIVAIGALPKRQTVCTVLIGSGAGTLTVTDAVRGLVEGIGEVFDEIAVSDELRLIAPVTKLVIAEQERGRAEEILESLHTMIGEHRAQQAAGRRLPVHFRPPARAPQTSPEGFVSIEETIALIADSAIRFAAGSPSSPERRALERLVENIPQPKRVQNLALAQLVEAGTAPAAVPRRPRFRVSARATDQRPDEIPRRLSFWSDGSAIRAAAIHEAATVSERLVTVAGDLLDDLIERMTDPSEEDVDSLCRLLYRLLVPVEFRNVLRSGPFVFEVDRSMAQVHWEMLAGRLDDGAPQQPLSVIAPFARQIRTQYSPSPLPPRRPRHRLRALVVGDPGDAAKGDSLPGARREALRVVELLRERGVDVEARIGAPGSSRDDLPPDVKPADRLDVLGLLLEGRFDLLHYAGHGDFDPSDPRRAGWLFERGLLTGGEIGRIEHVPAIVVANACLSARTSRQLSGGRKAGDDQSEAALLPSLADEFFHLGVRDYVGTAWEVNDIGAELFAETFYEALLPRNGRTGASFGEAVRLARASLWERRFDFGPLWAAYQHYGDPTVYATIAAAPSDG